MKHAFDGEAQVEVGMAAKKIYLSTLSYLRVMAPLPIQVLVPEAQECLTILGLRVNASAESPTLLEILKGYYSRFLSIDPECQGIM